MRPPTIWAAEELERDRAKAIEEFRTERLLEPIEFYSQAFDEFQGVVEELLETTLDLANLDSTALEVLCDQRLAP